MDPRGRPEAAGTVEGRGAAALPDRERAPRLAAPVHLLADSRLLFPSSEGASLLDRVRAGVRAAAPRAAYVGASNGDEPAFHDLFAAAMEGAGITAHRAVPSRPSAEDLAFLASADVVLLAGGDVARGWRTMAANGVAEAVLRRHRAGAALIGVSAGAVQLGLLGWPEGDPSPSAVFPTFGLVPFVVGAHEEGAEWAELRAVVAARGGEVRGVGIPFGGAVVVGCDGTVEAVRRPAVVIDARGAGTVASTLLPA